MNRESVYVSYIVPHFVSFDSEMLFEKGKSFFLEFVTYLALIIDKRFIKWNAPQPKCMDEIRFRNVATMAKKILNLCM